MPKFFTRLLPVLIFLLLLFIVGGTPGWAQVTLKPNGRNAMPLRTKSMQAEVTIDRQIAATHLILTFQNETQERIEADFIYTMPADSLVTSFAYWYGNEKVIARVVEKEEAASIYKHITTRMRDPALVEMIGKNTFRARIFPVMPNSDLKVEMNLVRALPSDEKGATYTFPLKAQKGDTLDRIAMKIDVKPSADVTRITNDNGLPVRQDANGYHLVVQGTNYRPQKDLRVTLVRPPRPLIAELAAAPSTPKRDGFFALAVTPDRDLFGCKIAVDGVETYQLVSGNHTSVKAHRSLFLFGRYKGSGSAKAILSGTSAQGPVTLMHPVVFGAGVQGNNPATKLWAARRMEQLSDSGSDGNREDVIALSKRFGMPSKYTSWLAVPKEEMARYEKEIAAAKIATVVRQLAGEIADGRANGPKAKELRAQYDYWRKVIGSNPEWAVSYSLGHDIQNVSAKLIEQINAHKENSRNAREYREQMRLLCKAAGNDAQQYINNALTSPLYALAQSIADAQYGDNPDRRKVAALMREFHRLEEMTGVSQSHYLEDAKREKEDAKRQKQQQMLSGLANDIVAARHAEGANSQRLNTLNGKFHRLTRRFGASEQQYLAGAELTWKYQRQGELRNQLFAEQAKDRPDAHKITRLQEQFIAVHDAQQQEYARKRAERIKIHAEQEKNNRLIASAQQAKDGQLAELQRKQEELRKQDDELRARQGDPLLRIDAPADAQQVIALLPNGEIKRLVYDGVSRQWEARFDIPTYAAEGAYVIKIIVVRKDGTRQIQTLRYHVDLTPPTGTGRAQLVTGAQSMLRLELEGGDDTARVKALLPWGETVSLKPSGQAHRFFALTPVPTGQTAPHAVTYILTDRAHNRTTITVDMR